MRVLYLSLIIVILDQVTKLKVKGISIPFLNINIQGMPYQSTVKVFEYFDITYIENPGMAFGLTVVNKLFLSLFTLFATFMILYFIYKNRNESTMFRLALAFILGGAIGNLIDRTFYGTIYNYAPLFYGRVVDFLHINVPDVKLFGKTIYNWPIFNIADLAVTTGFILIIFGYKKMFKKPEPGPEILPVVPEGNYFLVKDADGNVIEEKRSDVEHHGDTSFDDRFEHVETLESEKIEKKINTPLSNDIKDSDISDKSIDTEKFSDDFFTGKLKEDPIDLSSSNEEMKLENLGDLKKMHDEINDDNKKSE